MDSTHDDLVFIEIHMRPSILAELRAAARHADMPIEEWLTRLLAIGVQTELSPGDEV